MSERLDHPDDFQPENISFSDSTSSFSAKHQLQKHSSIVHKRSPRVCSEAISASLLRRRLHRASRWSQFMGRVPAIWAEFRWAESPLLTRLTIQSSIYVQ